MIDMGEGLMGSDRSGGEGGVGQFGGNQSDVDGEEEWIHLGQSLNLGRRGVNLRIY